MKAHGEIKFNNDDLSYNVKLLIDTGASHCFVNPKIFSESIRTKIEEFKANNSVNSLDMKIFNGFIQTVNANNVSCCVFVDLNLKIGKWSGIQEFIISDEIENENCILGRNFLKKNHVKIDYGNNKLTIKANKRKSIKNECVEDIGYCEDKKHIQRF